MVHGLVDTIPRTKTKTLPLRKLRVCYYFHVVNYSKNHVIPHPVIAAILNLNVSILRASLNDARDVIAAFKARSLFLAINLEILYNLCTEKCENNAFENSDTFDGWLCDFLF